MAVIGVGYSIASLSALLALDVTTLLDGYARYVNNDGWYQYRSAATTGGIAPITGIGRWFKSNGRGYSVPVSANFNAEPFGEYIGDNLTDIVMTLPATPSTGTPITIFTRKPNRVKVEAPSGFALFVNGVFLLDVYLASGKEVTLRYLSSGDGWVCPPEYILYGLTQDLYRLFFSDGTVLKSDLSGLLTFADTGSNPLTFFSGLVSTYALDFNSAAANYQLSSTNTGLSPVTTAENRITIAMFVNITSGTEPIISQKVTANANYAFALRVLDSTNIQLSVTTTAGTFTATSTVANAYGVNLMIIASMDTEFSGLSTKTMTLQVGSSTTLGAIVSTAFTGTFQASDAVVLGQSEAGNQIVGLVDARIRFYLKPLDTNRISLLWNNGAFA